MTNTTGEWTADPLVWGNGERLFEVFLEPTCPFSALAFAKLHQIANTAELRHIRVRIWLHSQPWHLFSGLICRAIVAASTGASGKEAAKSVMQAIYDNRESFEFDDHRAGSNLDTTPQQLIKRIERYSGIEISEAFQISGLESVVKAHCRYARQNGIHVSPTFMVDGLVDPTFSSSDPIEQWYEKLT